MNEIFSHWSAEPLVLDPGFSYKERGNFKPTGLWFDVDGDWRRWCEGESFREGGFVYRNVLTLDESRLLRLSDGIDIDSFTTKYARIDTERKWAHPEIQWDRLKSQYAGIVIAPYCWERRMSEHTFWYYPWDCASGCIWDLSAVLSVDPQLQTVMTQ